MIHLHLTAGDLRRVRFAVSPLWETVASVRTLAATSDGHHMHRAWRRRTRHATRGLALRDLELLATVIRPAGYIPDFLVTSPPARSASFENALEQVAATDPEVVAHELSHLAAHRVAQAGPGQQKRRALLQSLVDRPDAGLGPLTAALRAYHAAAIAPDWPRIEALLRDDIAHRLQMLADGGVDWLMRDLHPSVACDGDTVRIVKYYEGHVDLGGRGLLLLPCVFAWPDVIVQTAEPSTPTISYSPRGLGKLWSEPSTETDTALIYVLGRTRATLLTQMDLPMSTLQAASQLALAAPSVNVHMQALRAAGLLGSRREGRQVLYFRTPLAEELLQAAVGG